LIGREASAGTNDLTKRTSSFVWAGVYAGGEAMPKSDKLYRFLPLPPDFDPVDATVAETASYRRESPWTVFRKIREGRYQSYKDGKIRKIIFASVKADRQRSIARSAPATGKRKPGRPRKPRPDEQPQTAAE
jgi:hypothetical protein